MEVEEIKKEFTDDEIANFLTEPKGKLDLGAFFELKEN